MMNREVRERREKLYWELYDYMIEQETNLPIFSGTYEECIEFIKAFPGEGDTLYGFEIDESGIPDVSNIVDCIMLDLEDFEEEVNKPMENMTKSKMYKMAESLGRYNLPKMKDCKYYESKPTHYLEYEDTKTGWHYVLDYYPNSDVLMVTYHKYELNDDIDRIWYSDDVILVSENRVLVEAE